MSFGLQQVRERLATYYGDKASLSLNPAGDEEGGTLALVRLPLPRLSFAPRAEPMQANALIAEDEPLLAASLQAMLQHLWPDLVVIASVTHGAAAVQQALALHPM